MIGRLVIGFTMGITSMNLPLYISEICPSAVRGRVVALYTFLIVVGQLVANVISLMLVKKWRYILSFGCLLAIF